MAGFGVKSAEEKYTEKFANKYVCLRFTYYGHRANLMNVFPPSMFPHRFLYIRFIVIVIQLWFYSEIGTQASMIRRYKGIFSKFT